MSGKTTFCLIRHGEADYELADRRGLVGGAREWVPLTANGRREIQDLARRLQSELPALSRKLILASPYTRAMESAAILNQQFKLALRIEFDLHEWLPDTALTYQSSAEILAAYDECLAFGGEWPAGERRKWEPFSILRKRVKSVLSRYLDQELVLVACHGAIITSLVGETVDTGEFRLYRLSEEVI